MKISLKTVAVFLQFLKIRLFTIEKYYYFFLLLLIPGSAIPGTLPGLIIHVPV